MRIFLPNKIWKLKEKQFEKGGKKEVLGKLSL